MKKAAFLLLAVLTAPVVRAAIAPPLYSLPAITFYDNGTAPLASGTPVVCTAVTILYSNTAGKAVQGLRVNGDSLVITTNSLLDQSSAGMVAPIYYGPSIVFNTAGVYRAYEFDIAMNCICFSPLGEFTILPLAEITPAAPTVEDAVTLNLVLGQTSGDPCVAYSGTATVKDSGIYLAWQELGLGRACLDTVYDTPVKYGPGFNLGTLGRGNYTVYVEDTVRVGAFAVSGILVFRGSVTIMKHPLSRMMSVPVPGALVTAIKAPQCPNWWGGDPFVPDTVTTTTNASGLFSMNIPYTGEDYEITVTKAGFHSQAIFTNNQPIMMSFPPQMSVSFELLQDSILPETGLTITVTANGAPVESAYVSLAGGREMLICPMVLAKTAAQSNAFGYTDRSGRFVVSSLSMLPYIDYVYTISKYRQGGSISRNGIVRLNKYWDNTLNIDLGTIAVEDIPAAAEAAGITVSPNPFNPAVKIAVSGQRIADSDIALAIYNANGKLIQKLSATSYQLTAGITWNASGLPSGIYLLHATVGKKTYMKKLILAK